MYLSSSLCKRANQALPALIEIGVQRSRRASAVVRESGCPDSAGGKADEEGRVAPSAPMPRR